MSLCLLGPSAQFSSEAIQAILVLPDLFAVAAAFTSRVDPCQPSSQPLDGCDDYLNLLVDCSQGLLATIMTNVITNKACVQVLIPIVVATYREQVAQTHYPPLTCALASMALSTPYGFATNLTVIGPGGC